MHSLDQFCNDRQIDLIRFSSRRFKALCLWVDGHAVFGLADSLTAIEEAELGDILRLWYLEHSIDFVAPILVVCERRTISALSTPSAQVLDLLRGRQRQ